MLDITAEKSNDKDRSMNTKTKHSISLTEEIEEWLSSTAMTMTLGVLNETQTIKHILHKLKQVYPDGIPEHEFYVPAGRIEQTENQRTAGRKVITFPGGQN